MKIMLRPVTEISDELLLKMCKNATSSLYLENDLYKDIVFNELIRRFEELSKVAVKPETKKS